jgi:hypothetical protein
VDEWAGAVKRPSAVELTLTTMAVSVRKLTVGEIVEVDGRRYEVAPTRDGELTLETPITPMDELHAIDGTKPASAADFERLSGDVPYDDEG